MMESILCACEGLPERQVAPEEHLRPRGPYRQPATRPDRGRREVSCTGIRISTQSKPGSIFGEMAVLLDVTAHGNRASCDIVSGVFFLGRRGCSALEPGQGLLPWQRYGRRSGAAHHLPSGPETRVSGSGRPPDDVGQGIGERQSDVVAGF
jgi:hypothetical protein